MTRQRRGNERWMDRHEYLLVYVAVVVTLGLAASLVDLWLLS